MKLARILASFCFLIVIPVYSQTFKEALDLYNQTKHDESLKILTALPLLDAEVYNLIAKNQYMLGDYDRALEFLQKSLKLESEILGDVGDNISDDYLWIGRAYGKKAESGDPSAIKNAINSRKALEKAVDFQVRNIEALEDLFEFYIRAPGFLGGSKPKASKIADTIKVLNIAEGHIYYSKLAENYKDFESAERYLTIAINTKPDDCNYRLDMAAYLTRRKRYDESKKIFEEANAICSGNPDFLFGKAQVYINSKRNLGEARRLLDIYISLDNLTPNNPSRYEARQLLKSLN